jgi:hypothetical protein
MSARAHDLRLLQLACEKEVIRAALADGDAVIRAIHVGVDPDRRFVAHEIEAFDQHVRRGERDGLAALRIDREEAEVRALFAHGLHRFARRVEDDEFQSDAEMLRQRALRSTHTPNGSPVAGFFLARIGLPRLIDARSVPVRANACAMV